MRKLPADASEHAQCAAAIRAELKRLWPRTKFWVKSERFAGGNAVNIDWHHGPTVPEVDEITKKFQKGYFNAMTDCYEFTNLRRDIPQVRFIKLWRYRE